MVTLFYNAFLLSNHKRLLTFNEYILYSLKVETLKKKPHMGRLATI